MEIRALTLEDSPACDRLMAEAFASGSRPALPPAEGKAEPKPRSLTWGLFDGARLVAVAVVHDLRLVWEYTILPMGGVAGVACAAEQRGRGHVASLLAHSLQGMRDSGQFVSGLYPFAYAFYRRHGWEWVGEKRHYKVPTADIRASPEGKHVRCYDGPEALEIVSPVYEAYARNRRSMTTRTDAEPNFWERVLAHRDNRTTYVQVYSNPENGQAEGYLTFRYPNSGEGIGYIGEFFANTPAAYRGLLSVLHYYGTQVHHVEFSAPSDDWLPLYAMSNDLSVKLSSIFMGRVVDVAPALAALTAPLGLSGKVVLQVADSQCDWNHQTFAVTLEAGHVTATPTTDASGIALDIQALTQAYWGQPALDLLRAAGRLSVTDEAQYEMLSKLLPPSICYLADHF